MSYLDSSRTKPDLTFDPGGLVIKEFNEEN